MFGTCPHRHRLAAALLSGLLVFQGVGWLVAWHTAHLEAHFSAQQVLSEENTPVSSVTLPMSLLTALQVGKKEIRYQGRLYDIRSSHLVGDSVRLVLYHDQREEALFNALGSLLSPSRDASSSLPSVLSWLAKWLSTTFVVPDALAFCLWVESAQSPLPVFAPTLATQQEPGIFGPPPEGDFSVE